jgi:hypothetical protein
MGGYRLDARVSPEALVAYGLGVLALPVPPAMVGLVGDPAGSHAQLAAGIEALRVAQLTWAVEAREAAEQVAVRQAAVEDGIERYTEARARLRYLIAHASRLVLPLGVSVNIAQHRLTIALKVCPAPSLLTVNNFAAACYQLEDIIQKHADLAAVVGLGAADVVALSAARTKVEAETVALSRETGEQQVASAARDEARAAVIPLLHQWVDALGILLRGVDLAALEGLSRTHLPLRSDGPDVPEVVEPDVVEPEPEA